eukprot:1789312-Prymnesium_polylepis.2
MAADEWHVLKSVAGTRSAEAKVRREMQEEQAVQEKQQAAAREKKVAAKAADWDAAKKADETYERRYQQYGKLLVYMQQSGNCSLGSDGAPNWPAPPVPRESGIVSQATAHLACFPPRVVSM